MKKLLAIALFTIMLTPLRANAFDWSNLFRWFFFGVDPVTVTTEDLTSTLKTIEEKSVSVDKSVQTSFLAVVPLLTKQSDADKYAAEIKKINAGKDSQAKKDTQILNLISDYTTVIKNNKVGVILIIKTLSDKDKETLSKNIAVLSEDVQTYKTLYKKGANLTTNITTTEDKAQTTAIANLTSASDLLKNKAEVVEAFANQLSTLAALAGVK